MVAQSRSGDAGPLPGSEPQPGGRKPRRKGNLLTTQERRTRLDAMIWGGITVSVLLHFLVLNFFPSMDAPSVSYQADELEVTELPPEVEIPPPPAAIARPAVPVVADAYDVDPEITIAPTTFAANPVEELPPPPEEKKTTQELYAAPTFTPYTVAPGLANRSEAAAAVLREWPSVLKENGVGGVAVVWIFIDTDGRVVNAQISESSGIPQLDEAALRAAPAFRFSPAMDRDRRVQVWVELPVTFTLAARQAG